MTDEGRFKIDFGTSAPPGLTRTQGERARAWLRDIIALHGPVEVDLSHVEAFAPSFADECFGKLLLELGEDEFRQKVRFCGGTPAVRTLINYVLRVRLSQLHPRATG